MEKIKRLRNRKEENEMQQIANKMPTPISLLSSSFPFQTNRYLNDIYFSKNQIVNFNQSPSLLHLLRKPIFSDVIFYFLHFISFIQIFCDVYYYYYY